MTALILPFAMTLAAFAFVFYRRRPWLTGSDSSHSSLRADAIAARLGMQIVEGDPSFDLGGPQRSLEIQRDTFWSFPFQWARSERKLRMTGAPGGRHAEVVYRDVFESRNSVLWREQHTETEARITIEVRAPFPPFEVLTARPSPYLVPKPALSLPFARFGDPFLDDALVLRTHDPRIAPLIAPALQAIPDHTYVHVLGAEGRISFVFARNAVPMLASGDRLLHVLDEQARAIEAFSARTASVLASRTTMLELAR